METFNYNIVKNSEIFQQNRLPAHSDHDFFYVEEGRENGKECRVSLNGIWKFAYGQNYQAAPKGFEQPDYDVSGWDDIRVPGHIQMQGYDSPMYVNTQYPWDGHEGVIPGEIPERFNPTATFVRTFTVPEFMKGHEIYISFQGAESGLALWLNGTYIGYSEDSFTPSEFDLTPYLVDGENRLAVQVFKWTAGSWCEDQDFFRFSGIFRDVWLYMVPAIHVRDMRIQTLLDDSYTDADLKLDVLATAKGSLRLTLKDGEAAVLEDQVELSEGKNSYTYAISQPKLWSAEKPNLYQLTLEVLDENGCLKERVMEHVGFRRFEIKNSIMYLNGKRIIFHGVNRHEFCSENGRCIKEEDIILDLITMKQNNINAIRTSHYPNGTPLYRLCDEYGFYMIDETNLETHGSWDAYFRKEVALEDVVPGNRPEYQELIIDRARSMFERDKNHPAILIWSCGNESFGGENIFQMSECFRKWDSTRPVHYEGVYNDRRNNNISDMESTMYIPVAGIREYLKEHRDKPYINCEYVHTMGNSAGAMHKYMELVDEEPLYQGGFIWDYIDQSLTLKDRYGNEFQGYGGDFGDRPCDFSFSGNGIVYGKDRDPSPKMQEVKYVYQNISIDLEETEKKDTFLAKIFNRSLFTNTDEYTCVVTVAKEEEILYALEGSIEVAPESKDEIALQLEIPEEAGEYVLTVAFELKEDEIWADAGHEVAYGQLMIQRGEKTCAIEPDQTEGKALQVTNGYHNVGARGENFEVLFSKNFGGLVSYRFAGKEMLSAIPKPNFWRAPTENDMANQIAFRAGQWKAASMYASTKYEHGRKDTICEVEEKENSLVVTYTYHLPVRPALDCKVRYEVFADGTVDTTMQMPKSSEAGELPAFEMMFTMDADYDRMTWYGLGPDETYLDRLHAKLDVYEGLVEDNVAKFLVPQECGNKVGVRWAQVTDAKGRGLMFAALPKNENSYDGVQIPTEGLQFSAMPYAPQELENAKHPTELPPVHYTTIRIGQQMGIGGDDTWGAEVHPEYLLDNTKDLEIRFRFRGLA